MKPLNRPMFRMGGPIKEGIMDGIEEPRQGFQNAGFVTGQQIIDANRNNPFLQSGEIKINPFTKYIPNQTTGPLDNLIKATMFDTEQFPLVGKEANLAATANLTDFYRNQTTAPIDEDNLFASTGPIKITGDKIKTNINLSEGSEEPGSEVISTDDIEEVETPFKSKTMIQKEKEFAGGKILSDPDKTPKDPKADSELLQKLGYDRAVRKGNYALIEAIRRGLTEGGVQGALDAAFAAGATDPYGEASKIRQAAELKEYERKTGLEDYRKKKEIDFELNVKKQVDSVRTKDYNFAKDTLKMTDDEALAYANKSSSVAENIFKVTSRSQGGFVAPAQLGDAIRASGEKVDAVFEKDDDATIEAYPAKDGEYVVFNQKIFVGYKDPNSDEVLLKRIR